jgi:peptidoglycan hydrolase-like protein with peptidoglycan-binding domain
MKPTYTRRRRPPAHREAAGLKKEGQQEQVFFGNQAQPAFFKPTTAMPQGLVQRKCADCEGEEKVQRMAGEKEEEKVQRAPENEEEKVQRAPEKKEEEKVQRAPEKEEEKVQRAPEKEEEKVQKKEASPAPAATATNYIGSINGKGQPLSPQLQSFYGSRIGADFSEVKIHTGEEAAASAKDINAQAYTYGHHIVFNEGKYRPETSEGGHLLAHELAHVVQQGGGMRRSNGGQRTNGQGKRAVVQRLPLLSAAEIRAAIAHNRRLFDAKSVMIVQLITGTTVDGQVGPLTAEAIAAFQVANGLPANGKVEDPTLEAMFTNRVTGGRHEHAIQLVIDYNGLNRSDVLNFHHDPAILLSNTSFQPGGLRVVSFGGIAFLSAAFLNAVATFELAKAPPALPALGPKPTHLTPAKEAAATSFNLLKYSDSRTVRAIQGIVGATPDGKFGGDTAERIAEFQSTNGISIDGKAGEETLRVMVPQLDAANQQDTAIRLIMDFYNMSEFGALIEIFFDPTLAGSNAETPSKDIPGPDIVKIGPLAFAQGYAGLVHTIAHELEHVRQNKLGIADIPLSEFLGEAIEIISKDMPDEDVAGFFDDAGRAMDNWDAMQVADQRRQWGKFVSVRNAVRRRFNAATAAEQATHTLLMGRYNAAVRPV